MKYHVNQEYKLAKHKGHTTKAAKLMLHEIRYNIDRIRCYQLQLQLLLKFYLPFSYIFSMEQVPKDVFWKLKKARDKVKTTITNLPPLH